MVELLRKDLGLCRYVLSGCAFALFVPYIAVVIYSLNAKGLSSSEAREFLSYGLLGAAQTSVALSLFSISFLGGFVVAGERQDRSAEFLAFLPPGRKAILLSKFIICAVWAIVVAIVYFLVADFFVPWYSNGEVEYTSTARDPLLLYGVMFSVFGVAWHCSCRLESPVFSVLAGLVTPYGVLTCLAAIELQFGYEFYSESGSFASGMVLLFLGVFAFVTGCVHYVRRVEP